VSLSLSLAEKGNTEPGRSRRSIYIDRTNSNSNKIISRALTTWIRLQVRVLSLLVLVLFTALPLSASFTPLSKPAQLKLSIKQPPTTAAYQTHALNMNMNTNMNTNTNMSTSKYEPGVDSTDSAQEYIQSVQSSSSSSLFIFGYGSLCWNPGSGILAHPSVSTQRGKALGYKRCWSQRSTDHRGNTMFPGLVCTLLSDGEYEEILSNHVHDRDRDQVDKSTSSINISTSTSMDGSKTRARSMTEGVLFEIPQELVQECLNELDFREKGGYSRDVITVLLDSPEIHDTNNRNANTNANAIRNGNANANVNAGEGHKIQALLYRGTPSNPSFTNRALLDKVYAAAVISAAIGPSGKNDAYLYELDEFLAGDGENSNGNDNDNNDNGSNIDNEENTKTVTEGVDNYRGDSLTGQLTFLSKYIQEHHHVYFLYGSGSNQHNQLLLDIDIDIDINNNSTTTTATSDINININAANLIKGDEAHDLKEMVLLVPKIKSDDDNIDTDTGTGGHQIKYLYAGGAHCALLTDAGHMYLWGLNDCNQLGTSQSTTSSRHTDTNTNTHTPTKKEMELNHPIVSPLDDILVEMAALGHDHTLVIEKGTGVLFSFGNDSRGQVSGNNGGSNGNDNSNGNCNSKLTRLDLGSQVVHVAAGLFHSAAVTADGELVTFGCSKFGQSFSRVKSTDETTGMKDVKRWKPDDGSRIVKVACGRSHTICLDDRGRVYSMGNNKYGQLGRRIAGDSNSASRTGTGSQKKSTSDGKMKLVIFPNDEKCIDIDCGWHHSITLVADDSGNNGIDIETSTFSTSSTSLYGFGRNDKGQLGIGSEGSEHTKANAAKKTTLISSPTKIIPIGKSTCDGVDNHDVNFVIKHFSCGAESTSIVDHKDRIISCGWNEHGNLGCGVINVVNDANGAATEVEIHECRHTFTPATGADICSPQFQRGQSNHDDNNDDDGNVGVDTTTMMGRRIILASGGAHLIATIV